MVHCILIGFLLLAGVVVRSWYVEKSSERARRLSEGGFLLAFSGLLAKMAMADGTVSADEIETVEKMFADMGLSRAEHAMCVGNFVLVRREGGEAGEWARKLGNSFNHVACRFLYGLVLRVALADRRIADGEERLLKEIAGALGLSEEERAEFRQGKAPSFDKAALEDAGVPAAVVRLGR